MTGGGLPQGALGDGGCWREGAGLCRAPFGHPGRHGDADLQFEGRHGDADLRVVAGLGVGGCAWALADLALLHKQNTIR